MKKMISLLLRGKICHGYEKEYCWSHNNTYITDSNHTYKFVRDEKGHHTHNYHVEILEIALTQKQLFIKFSKNKNYEIHYMI